MIHVKRNGLSIKISGHAESAEYGKDLICASASILFYTLVGTIDRYERMNRCKAIVKPLEGDAEVKVATVPDYHDEITQVFNTIMVGYEILAESYPEYVSVDA